MPQLRGGHPEPGALAAHPQVARDGHLGAASDREALDERDRGLRAPDDRLLPRLHRLAVARRPSASARNVANSAMSAPALNGPPGVPRTSTTSTSSSAARTGISRANASHIAYEMAFCLSGRSKARSAIPSSL